VGLVGETSPFLATACPSFSPTAQHFDSSSATFPRSHPRRRVVTVSRPTPLSKFLPPPIPFRPSPTAPPLSQRFDFTAGHLSRAAFFTPPFLPWCFFHSDTLAPHPPSFFFCFPGPLRPFFPPSYTFFPLVLFREPGSLIVFSPDPRLGFYCFYASTMVGTRLRLLFLSSQEILSCASCVNGFCLGIVAVLLLWTRRDVGWLFGAPSYRAPWFWFARGLCSNQDFRWFFSFAMFFAGTSFSTPVPCGAAVMLVTG